MSSLTLKNGGKIVGDVLQAYCMGKETYKGEIICPDFVEVPQQVCIIERGDILKYVSFDTLTFYVPYANVKEIVRPARKMEELSGLIDEIETREGMIVKGKIIRQEVGVSVCLKTENGILEVISNKNILAQRKLPLNGNMSIFEQSQFLDVVRLKDDKEYEGVLIEQNYGSSSIPGYFVILTQDGKSHKKKLSDLKCTVKKLNPEYLNLFDIILDKYEFVVNRQKVDAVNIMRLEVTREIVLPSDKSISVENLVANTIPVDSPCLKIKKSSLVDNKIQFEFKNGIDKRFLIIRPIVRERKQAKYESFTDNEFRSSGIHPLSTSISKNNTVKLEYDVVNLDKFLIYNEKEGLAIYCKIEE